MSKKKKIVIIGIVIAVGCIVALMILNQGRNCLDIIGDGYDMGTDPEPVVIGNTCDK